MAAIEQTTFSWMTIVVPIKFHWNLFQGSNWLYFIISPVEGLARISAQAINYTNDGLFYLQIYVSLSLSELMVSWNSNWDMVTIVMLTHCGQVLQYGFDELSNHESKWWPVACLVPSHYLDWCCFIINLKQRNKFPWRFHQNKLFFQGNIFKTCDTHGTDITHMPEGKIT